MYIVLYTGRKIDRQRRLFRKNRERPIQIDKEIDIEVYSPEKEPHKNRVDKLDELEKELQQKNAN